MLFFKYLFLTCIFIVAVLIGRLLSRKYKNRVKELKGIKEVLNVLETKIKFTYEPLGDILSEISIMIKDKKICMLLNRTTNNLKQSDFTIAWNNSLNSMSSIFNLNEEDMNIIRSLGNMLRKD